MNPPSSTSTTTYAGLPEYTGQALQSRLDDAIATGQKQVVVPSGIYRLRDALHLRSGIHLKGEGMVILQTQPIVSSALQDIVGYGHSEFRVADASQFSVGQGVTITAANKGGFGVTVGSIISQQDNTFYIDAPGNADYWPSQGAVALTAYPAIKGENVQDILIENITILGSHQPGNPWVLNGCRNGGVFLIGCANVHLKQMDIHHYPGDGVSFQQCVDVYVQDCDIHHNAGHGLHPGSGTVRYVLAGNRIAHNGDCGVYYCLRTTHSICRDNHIHHNVNHGVTIGERDTHHLIMGNVIGGNGKSGVMFRKPVIESGNHVVLKGNRFEASAATSDRPAIDIASGLVDVHLVENVFEGAGLPVRVGEGCRGMTLHGNLRDGLPMDASACEAGSALIEADEGPMPEIDPSRLSLDQARHLRRAKLEVWVDRTIDESP